VSGVENLPDEPPYILAVSHVNYLDAPMVTAAVIRARGKAVSFLTKMPIVKMFGPLSRGYLGMIPVDPVDKKLSVTIACQRLAAGKIVGIFPEGTRNADPSHLLRGKTGAARLAHLTGVPVIPVGTFGPTKISAFKSLRLALTHGTHLAVKFGPAIRFPMVPEEQLTKELLVNSTRVIMRAIGKLTDKSYDF
jgi:1-acyl-sn-glycerol-3-phosphate acyltransferase